MRGSTLMLLYTAAAWAGAGALKTLAESRSLALPLKLFEVGDVVLVDGGAEAGARNERRLCAVCCANSDTFEAMHGLLLWLMRALGVPCRLDGDGALFFRPGTSCTGVQCTRQAVNGRLL